MDAVKEGILSRKPRQYHNRNESTIDKHYEKEQLKLQAKRDKLNNIMEHRKTAFNGAREDNYVIKGEFRKETFKHLELQKKLKEDEQMRHKLVVLQSDLVQQQRHEALLQRLQNLKDMERQLMKENQKLAEERRRTTIQQKTSDFHEENKILKKDPFRFLSHGR
mmetsp:Transcript_15522/g.17895  ORF Transcript_15522/g.17895 Transcript_15522/m.17895 type:complete len:164 (-) Transcript_15522:125-616(-)